VLSHDHHLEELTLSVELVSTSTLEGAARDLFYFPSGVVRETLLFIFLGPPSAGAMGLGATKGRRCMW